MSSAWQIPWFDHLLKLKWNSAPNSLTAVALNFFFTPGIFTIKNKTQKLAASHLCTILMLSYHGRVKVATSKIFSLKLDTLLAPPIHLKSLAWTIEALLVVE